MSDLFCEYHPQRQAVEKCDRCNRLICLQDKINRTITTGTGGNRYYQTQVDICPLCLVDISKENQVALDKSKKLFAVFIAFVISMITLFFIFVAKSIQDFNDRTTFIGGELPFNQLKGIILLFSAFLLLIIFLFFMFLKLSQKKIDEMTENSLREKEKFLNTIKDPSIRSRYSEKQLTCFQCGNTLGKKDLFCLNCGDSTADERKAKDH